jgi:hypothetical protein
VPLETSERVDPVGHQVDLDGDLRLQLGKVDVAAV